MPLKDVVKISRKTYFNPRGWLGYDMIKAQLKTTVGILKNAFTPAKTTRKETFAEAAARFNLSDAEIQQIGQRYWLAAMCFAVLGLLTFIFSFYLIIHHGSISGWLLGLATTGLFWAYGFRYHFWSFQIKNRKLGCTLAEWRRGKPFEDGNPHD